MVLVAITRHGETTWNMEGRYQGRLESALSALGVRQAEALAERMSADPPQRIVSSPLLRCTATAQFVATRVNVPIETDDRLIEIAHGDWEGRLRDDLAANDPERYRTWRERPAEVSFVGGESLRDVMERWKDFARSLRPDRPTLIVTHDAVVRCAILDITRRPLEEFWQVPFENAALALCSVEQDAWHMVNALDNAHLAGLRADVAGQAL